MGTDDLLDLSYVSFEGKRAPSQLPGDARGPAPCVARSPSAVVEPLDPFCHRVLTEAGLDAASYRTTPLHRRVPACLRALRAQTVADAQVRMRQQPYLVAHAVSSLLIGVTEFWRDAYVFDALRATVLPTVRDRCAPIRVWSAACSTGEELYTVAILLADAGLLDRAELVGTDCRADAIERAAESIYTASSVDAVPEAARLRFFEPAGSSGLRPVSSLRARTRWRVADLLQEVEPGPWDIILWRNTAIYLNHDVAARIFARLISQLAPGGFLVVGKAERPPAGAPVTFVRRCVYRKGGEACAAVAG